MSFSPPSTETLSERPFGLLLFRELLSLVGGLPFISLFSLIGLLRSLAAGSFTFPLILAGFVTIYLAFHTWRVLLLRHVGVEVVAELVDVETIDGHDTDLTSAIYAYDFEGRAYRYYSSAGTGLGAVAKRHGYRVVLLVDPSKPSRALILRSA